MTETPSKHANPSVALVSGPWPLFSRPSIQLGALKAFLKAHVPGLSVVSHHHYLQVAHAVGFPLFHEVSQRSFSAEAVYAALLFPEHKEAARKVFEKAAIGNPALRKVDFDRLCDRALGASMAFVDSVDWSRYRLAGFSVCLCQLTASLWLIRKIKAACPALPIVVGGSGLAGQDPARLFAAFPEIDFFIRGEGERPLARLAGQIVQGTAPADIVPGDSLFSRHAALEEASGFCQLENVDALPVPDFDDYFSLQKSFGPTAAFFPTLPVEFSRGCWWKAASSTRKGCAFCNLNLQWSGYRAKSPARSAKELDRLTSRYGLVSAALTDNLVPPRTAEKTFSAVADLEKDLSLFCEIRAVTSAPVFAAMKKAGIREVQIGVEALSSGLLKKMGKGTTALDNLMALKLCTAFEVFSRSNLILGFPGSDEKDVAETLRTLSFAGCFTPLRTVTFWLGFHSPVWSDPAAFGIRSVFKHPDYCALFPRDIREKLDFMVYDYRGDKGKQKRLWRPVKAAVEEWKKAYAALFSGTDKSPVLGYRDGKTAMIIRQRRAGKDPMTHRLTGASREIYLFCERHRGTRRILSRFPGLPEENVAAFLKMMTDKKLMYEEAGRYLSLAAPLTEAGRERMARRIGGKEPS